MKRSMTQGEVCWRLNILPTDPASYRTADSFRLHLSSHPLLSTVHWSATFKSYMIWKKKTLTDVVGSRQLRSASRGLLNFSLQHVKLWSTCVLFCWSLCLKLTAWAYAAININSCLQALTKDISTQQILHLYKCTDLLLITWAADVREGRFGDIPRMFRQHTCSDVHEAFQAKTESEVLTDETRHLPDNPSWDRGPRWDRDGKASGCLKMASRPRRLDRGHIPGIFGCNRWCHYLFI